ncbi:MAG: GntR family transcriptional regulator [Alphaproteobacteria bacterium]|nr:GntR family transcriptional regulator [Alphaproteobacteria bacterium]
MASVQSRETTQTTTPRNRRGERARTIPEQIADHLGIAILNGEYKGGERISEQEVARLYASSRGPVREAIRALEKRGLVELFPRRGAWVVDITLDAIADIFNIRAVLLGLAARNVAARPDAPEAIAEMLSHCSGLRVQAARDDVDPVAFALAVGRTGGIMYRQCATPHLIRMLRDQNQGSLWGLIWRERPLDFFTAERRRETAQDWSDIAQAIAQRDGARAERVVRKALYDSRDGAMATLKVLRGETVDPAKFIRD